MVEAWQGSQTPKSRKKKMMAGVKQRTFTEKRNFFECITIGITITSPKLMSRFEAFRC